MALDRILDRIRDAIAVLDREWRYQSVNARACELSGLRAEQMVGRVIWDLFPALAGTEMERALRAAMDGEPQQLRFYFEPLRRWYDQRIHREGDDLAIISTDVTDQVTLEERFLTLGQSMPHIVWTAAPDGTITFINRRWTDLTGLDLAATNAPGVTSVFHHDDTERAFTRWSASLASGTPHEVEWRFRRASDGEHRWFLTRAIPRRDASGKVVEWFGTATDIHELKLAEQKLLLANRRIARIQEVTSALSSATTATDVAEVTCRIGSQAMEAQAGVLWLLDDRGRLVMAGSWGTPKEWISRFSVLEPDDPRFPAIKVVKTGEPVFVENREDYQRVAPEVLVQAEAVSRVAAYAALPLASEGRVSGVIVFSHPLGHHYDEGDRAFYRTLAANCQQALQRARLLDEARVANRAKDEFLAMLGHELRNPLAPIVTALEMIRAREATQGREHSIIERQVQHLRRLVDDLLDVSAIAAGRVQLEVTRVAMEEVVERALETTRPLIDQRRHAVELDVERGLFLDGDGFRLTQVVTNLLTNAAKYTPTGGHIRVSAWREGSSIVIRVKDDGAGITPELMPRIFEMFHQGPQMADRAQGGLGLGLSIVRSLVTLHRGTVSVQSEGANRGSEFVVTLPAAESNVTAVAASPPGFTHPLLTGRRILIVDDNEDAAVLLAEALQLDGAICLVAHSPVDALLGARDFRAEVALLDIGLPEIDGYQLSHALRKLEPTTRMIAVSGYGLESDRERSRNAGFDGHLVKPVQLGKLRDVIFAALRSDLAR